MFIAERRVRGSFALHHCKQSHPSFHNSSNCTLTKSLQLILTYQHPPNTYTFPTLSGHTKSQPILRHQTVLCKRFHYSWTLKGGRSVWHHLSSIWFQSTPESRHLICHSASAERSTPCPREMNSSLTHANETFYQPNKTERSQKIGVSAQFFSNKDSEYQLALGLRTTFRITIFILWGKQERGIITEQNLKLFIRFQRCPEASPQVSLWSCPRLMGILYHQEERQAQEE